MEDYFPCVLRSYINRLDCKNVFPAWPFIKQIRLLCVKPKNVYITNMKVNVLLCVKK